jgi:hypothetical protein
LLKYSFGATGATPKFTQTVSSPSGALNLAFEFEITGAPLTLVDADAINPLSSGKELGGVSPEIYVTKGLGGPVVLGPSFFALDTPIHSYQAATDSVTLGPGNYYEYIVGSITPGTVATHINVGAFAGAAVPEPASWALMILGVAGTGAVLRRRRTTTLASALA